MSSMIWDDIQIQSPFAAEKLLNIKMRANANRHTALLFQCLVKPNNFSCEVDFSKKPINFIHNEDVFFAGYIVQIKAQMKNDSLLVTGLCLSSSSRMDGEEHCRSFQDKGRKCKYKYGNYIIARSSSFGRGA